MDGVAILGSRIDFRSNEMASDIETLYEQTDFLPCGGGRVALTGSPVHGCHAGIDTDHIGQAWQGNFLFLFFSL